MDTRLGIDNRDEKIKKDGMDDTKNSITVSQKKAEELYSSLERL
jgi:hypothetical protein